MSLDDDALAARIAAALPTARWFAAKGVLIEAVTLHDRFPAPPAAGAPRSTLVLADVHGPGPDASPHRYCLVVNASGDDDAGDPAAVRWLVDTILSATRTAGRAGTLAGHPVAGCTIAWPSDATVSAAGGDASNSSFAVRSAAGGLFLKIFRRLRTGIQPEVEIGEFLATAATTGWRGAPRLLGWLEYVSSGDGDSTALATLQELAPGCTTAWERVVGLLVAAGPHAVLPPAVTALAARLGAETGRMHAALASRPDLPAFAPEPATAAFRSRAAERMAEHAADVFALVESRLPHVAASLARRLRDLLAVRSTLADRFAPLATLALDVPNIRVHGDYHLGQVLVDDRDSRVLVVDFEGEPGRPVEERRAKMSAAKDVAGMCRSFDYALRHAAATTSGPYRPADLRRLEAAFLAAYRAASAGGAWWPADDATATRLLDVHRLDKAIYELAYEIGNRPDWIEVPLAAIEELAATPAPSRV